MAGGKRQLRLIGGTWGGRKLGFPALPDLRPTGDRTRETLFNWLQPVLPGSRCLDLFAGSGALGLEAASRGASQVVLLEQAAPALRHLRDAVALLQADQVQVVAGDALRFLGGPATPFDIVFLDPPFTGDLLATAAARLEQGGWLAPGARIYVEQARSEPAAVLPENWDLSRDKQAGQVRYALYQRAAGASS